MKNKPIPCDVLVAGAGLSGVAAAISASRRQAKTVLIEKNNFPGGLASDCRHSYLCGLYPKNTGLAKEVILQLQKLNPQNKFTRIGKLPAFFFRSENLGSILGKLLNKEKNLQVFYNCEVVNVKKEGSSIVCVETNSKPLNLCLNFAPKTVIDASGEGSIIKLSKAKHLLSPLKSRQLAGFTFQVRGLADTAGLLPIKVPYYLTIAVKQKKLPGYFKFTNFYYGPTKSSGMIKLNLPPKNTHRGPGKTQKYAALIQAYLRKILPEFKHSRIQRVASTIHKREGLRLLGKHILTKKEILSSRKFPDAIAKGYWPVEFWDQKQGQKIKYLKPGKFYEIPLSCLKSSSIDNLFATGKCISATSKALASTRVTGTCIYLGEAAGRQAAQRK